MNAVKYGMILQRLIFTMSCSYYWMQVFLSCEVIHHLVTDLCKKFTKPKFIWIWKSLKRLWSLGFIWVFVIFFIFSLVISLFWAGHGTFCTCTIGDSSAGSSGSLALVTPPLSVGRVWKWLCWWLLPLIVRGVQLLVSLLVITQWENLPHHLQVTPACQSQSLLMTPHHSGEGGWTHCGVSSPGAFCGAGSRLPHCRWWATLAVTLL